MPACFRREGISAGDLMGVGQKAKGMATMNSGKPSVAMSFTAEAKSSLTQSR